MSFDDAMKLFPVCLVGGCDLAVHKNVADLRFVARHELDLYEEGDIELSDKDVREIRKFLSKTGK